MACIDMLDANPELRLESEVLERWLLKLCLK